jgi:hypothetical protein
MLNGAEQRVICTARLLSSQDPPAYQKCAALLRRVLESEGQLNDETEFAIQNTGYEHVTVGELYDALRSLVRRGLLESRGDLRLPAGPRFTECRISELGHLKEE